MRRCCVATFFTMLAMTAHADPAKAPEASYLGAHDAIAVDAAGCNSSAYSEVPGSKELLLGRLLLTAEGELPALNGPPDCSGGNPDNPKSGKIFSRWALTLHRFDWNAHRIGISKVVLDTSLDPATHQARAVIRGGPMRGAVIQSAYDPVLAHYRGADYVVFECIVSNGASYGVDGTSSCIGVYDPAKQEVDLARTQVIVSGIHKGSEFYAASVPQLLVFQDRLFLYWSALRIVGNKFQSIAVRGAELEVGAEVSIKGSGGHLVHTIDEPATVEVWAPQPGDPLSDTAVDARALWSDGKTIVALSGKGGSGCTAPDGTQRGCFRLAITRAEQPLGRHVFNQGQAVNDARLPSNPQEYTAPIHDPQGRTWLIGHYIKPPANGWSELRPVPGGDYWAKLPAGTARMVMFPLDDPELLPR
jgi:hypothetical protein